MSGELECFEAPGLPADWLNAWLAAIGVTVLLPDVKLSWSDEVVPTAQFWVADMAGFASALAGGIPKAADLKALAIASDGPGGTWGQKIKDFELYSERCAIARVNSDSTVSATVSDLGYESDGTCPARGKFCAGMEGEESLWKRLLKCTEAVESADSPAAAIEATLSGDLRRVAWLKSNGLGFDPRRMTSGTSPLPSQRPTVDPVVETLVFYGICQMPVRGSGRPKSPVVQKPWRRNGNSVRLVYPTWRDPLDRWAIDAYLDLPVNEWRSGPSYLVRPYVIRDNEKKVAYFSKPVT